MHIVIAFERWSMRVYGDRLKNGVYGALYGCFAEGSLDSSVSVPIPAELVEKSQVPCEWYRLEIEKCEKYSCCPPGEDWPKHGGDGHGGLASDPTVTN